MTRVQRALGRVDLDGYARARGVASAAEFRDLAALIHRVAAGDRVTERDVAKVIQRNPHIDARDVANGAQWINGGATAHERAERVAKGVAYFMAQANGVPVDARRVLAEGARVGKAIATQDFAADLTGRLDARDAHRDRQHGIDERARVEQARRAAMQNPEAIRRADIERAVGHLDPRPTLYAAERRELYAQGIERVMDRMREKIVRDADPHRAPDRGDDRRDDIALQLDRQMVNEAADDELALRDNGLERVDDALTAEEVRERDQA